MSALEFCKYFLIMLSAFSIVFTVGMGFAGVLVGKQPLAYTFLEVASGSAVVSSFIVALVAVVMIRGIEGDGPQGRTGEVELERGLAGKELRGVLNGGRLERRLSEDLAVIQGGQTEPTPETLNEGLHAYSTDTQFERQPSNKRRRLAVRGFLILFLIVLLGELAPISVLWALGFAVTNAKLDNSSLPIHTYLLTEMLAGILPPVLIIASSALAMMVVNYTGSGKVDIRDLIARCLPSVALFKGTNHDYWIIVKTFYFKTKKTEMPKPQKHWYPTYFKSCVTLELAVIASVILLETFLVFAGLTVSNLEAFDSCQEVDINTNTFTCYSGETWQRVNCSQNSTSHVLCFEFVSARSLIEVVPGSLVAAIAVVVGFIELFDLTFKVVRALLRCKSANVWGATVTSMGILVLLVSPVQIFLMFKYPVHYKPTGAITTGLFGVYIITMGLLLIKIKWWEKPKEDNKDIELVSVGTPKSKQFGKKASRVTKRAKVHDPIKQTNYAGTNPRQLSMLHATDFTEHPNVVPLNAYTTPEENEIHSDN